MSIIARALRRLAAECEQYSSRTPIKSRHWRRERPSDRQVARIRRWVDSSRPPWRWGWVLRGSSKEQRQLIEEACKGVLEGRLDRGATSDLMSLLMHPLEHDKRWMPWRSQRDSQEDAA